MNIGPASLQFIVQLSVPAAFIVSLLLLWLYMRAVKRSMHSSASPAPLPKDTAPSGIEPSNAPPPPTPLQIAIAAPPEAAFVRLARRGTQRAAAVQIVAGTAYALTLSMSWWSMTGVPYQWDAIAVIALMFAWPLVIVVGLGATVSWRGFACSGGLAPWRFWACII